MSKEFNANEEAKRWVKHAVGLGVIAEDKARFVEGSLTGWFISIYTVGFGDGKEALDEYNRKTQGR